MDRANRGGGLFDIVWNRAVILSRENQSDLAVLLGENLTDVLETVVLADSVKSVVDILGTGILQRLLDSSHHCRVSLSVIDNSVTLLSVNEGFYKCLTSSGNGNDWMDVRQSGKLYCVCSL